MTITIDLALIKPDQLSLVGSKALNLSKLIQEGIQVPKGFVITCSAYKKFSSTISLLTKIPKENDISTIQKFCADVQKEIRQNAVPKDIMAEVLSLYETYEGTLLAVRSSAVAEDTGSYSFAGQYDTFLGVCDKKQLEQAILNCWASVWSYNSFIYRVQTNQELDPGNIAIIVQKMVNANSSGIIFTQNPITNRSGEILIDAGWGLGESIVSGKTNTDSYAIDEAGSKIINKSVRYKNLKCVLKDNETQYVNVSEEDRNTQVLSDSQILELSKIASNIHKIFQENQDIEWAYDQEKFHILQSRPITTVLEQHKRRKSERRHKLEKGILWSIVDTGEAFTGLFTPLGISYYNYIQTNMLPTHWRGFGIKFVGDTSEYGKFFYGRLYLNVSYLAWLLAQTANGQDHSVLLNRLSEGIDLSDYKNPYGQRPVYGWKYISSNLFFLRFLVKLFTVAKSRADREIIRRFKDFDRFYKLDLKSLSMEELNKELKNVNNSLLYTGVYYVPFWIGQFVFFDILQVLSKKWLKDEDGSTVKRIRAGVSDLRTLEFADSSKFAA